jgi:hypothetical protein
MRRFLRMRRAKSLGVITACSPGFSQRALGEFSLYGEPFMGSPGTSIPRRWPYSATSWLYT